jgi:hypothetical protein
MPCCRRVWGRSGDSGDSDATTVGAGVEDGVAAGVEDPAPPGDDDGVRAGDPCGTGDPSGDIDGGVEDPLPPTPSEADAVAVP